jgi:hypothetical protein
MAGEEGRKPTRVPTRGGRAGALLCASLCAAALLSSCDVIKSWFVDEFADYRDSDTNFIAAEGLDKQDLTTAGYETPAVWTWAWRNDDHADDTSGYTYMTLVSNGTAGSGYSGLASTAPVYRLTLRNLVADGDFENGVPSAWGTIGSGATAAIDTSATMIHASGQSCLVTTVSDGGVSFALSTLRDFDGSTNYGYTWTFYNKNASYYYLQTTSGGTFLSYKDATVDLVNETALSSPRILLNAGESSAQILLFGRSGTPGSFEADDVRVVRSDIKDHSCVRLLLRPSDTSPTLTRGYFDFTVWVRKPSGYYFPSDDAAAAPSANDYTYAASKVTLWMGSPSGSDGSCSVTASVASSGWTQISLRQNANGNFADLDPTSADPQVELQIYPFDMESPEPGAVEIAQPELHFYLDGY